MSGDICWRSWQSEIPNYAVDLHDYAIRSRTHPFGSYPVTSRPGRGAAGPLPNDRLQRTAPRAAAELDVVQRRDRELALRGAAEMRER